MGKGDKKTKKGKISKGSYGVRRPKPGGTAFPAKDREARPAKGRKKI